MLGIVLAISGLGILQLPNLSEPQLPSYLHHQISQELPSFDLFSDHSYQKFLDDDHGFAPLDYKPADLAPIISDFTSNDSQKFTLRKEAWIAFADMARHFQEHFQGKKKLSIVSAYRSYTHQQSIKKKGCKDIACAKAGTSEHQAWLALDLGINWASMQSFWGEAFTWLQENAHKWWFHNTYQKGVAIDGKIIEPWHWRYLWVTLATELKEKNQTFREWVIQHQSSLDPSAKETDS